MVLPFVVRPVRFALLAFLDTETRARQRMVTVRLHKTPDPRQRSELRKDIC